MVHTIFKNQGATEVHVEEFDKKVIDWIKKNGGSGCIMPQGCRQNSITFLDSYAPTLFKCNNYVINESGIVEGFVETGGMVCLHAWNYFCVDSDSESFHFFDITKDFFHKDKSVKYFMVERISVEDYERQDGFRKQTYLQAACYAKRHRLEFIPTQEDADNHI